MTDAPNQSRQPCRETALMIDEGASLGDNTEGKP